MLYKCLQQQNLVQFLCKRRQIPPIPCSPERAARARTPRITATPAEASSRHPALLFRVPHLRIGKVGSCGAFAKTPAASFSQAAKLLRPLRPIEAIERELHLLPKLFERLAAHRKPHKSFRNIVPPARAPFRGSVHASEARSRSDEFAAIDEFLGGALIVQRHADNHGEAQHLALCHIVPRMRRKSREPHLPHIAMFLETTGQRLRIAAHTIEAHLQRLQPPMNEPGLERPRYGPGELPPIARRGDQSGVARSEVAEDD